MKHSSAQSGSVLFIIMIAVAMFAALSYIIIKGGRSGSVQAITDDQARVAATEIIAYGDALTKTIQTLTLRGCKINQFDFSNSQWKLVNGTLIHYAGQNPTALTNGCSVFSPTDGKMQAIVFPRTFFSDYPLTATHIDYGSATIGTASMSNLGTSSTELIYILPHVHPDVCAKIHQISGYNTQPTVLASVSWGTYNGNMGTGSIPDTGGELSGKNAYCVVWGGSYHFVRSLVTR